MKKTKSAGGSCRVQPKQGSARLWGHFHNCHQFSSSTLPFPTLPRGWNRAYRLF